MLRTMVRAVMEADRSQEEDPSCKFDNVHNSEYYSQTIGAKT